MAEDNRSLIRKFFNPYPEPTSVQDLGKTGKKYFVGSDKGLSSYFKDYTDPNITVGETLAKGVSLEDFNKYSITKDWNNISNFLSNN